MSPQFFLHGTVRVPNSVYTTTLTTNSVRILRLVVSLLVSIHANWLDPVADLSFLTNVWGERMDHKYRTCKEHSEDYQGYLDLVLSCY